MTSRYKLVARGCRLLKKSIDNHVATVSSAFNADWPPASCRPIVEGSASPLFTGSAPSRRGDESSDEGDADDRLLLQGVF